MSMVHLNLVNPLCKRCCVCITFLVLFIFYVLAFPDFCLHIYRFKKKLKFLSLYYIWLDHEHYRLVDL